MKDLGQKGILEVDLIKFLIKCGVYAIFWLLWQFIKKFQRTSRSRFTSIFVDTFSSGLKCEDLKWYSNTGQYRDSRLLCFTKINILEYFIYNFH